MKTTSPPVEPCTRCGGAPEGWFTVTAHSPEIAAAAGVALNANIIRIAACGPCLGLLAERVDALEDEARRAARDLVMSTQVANAWLVRQVWDLCDARVD